MASVMNVLTRNNMKIDRETIKGKALFLSLDGDLIGEQSGVEILDIANIELDNNLDSCIVDMENVRYMNSSGIGVLITILTKVKNKNGQMVLVKPSVQIVKLLEITKLDSVFTIVNSKSEAEELV